jgi:hypothetical protein
MARGFPESDWREFRQLRELALQRFCQRVLIEVEQISSDPTKSFHDRYLRVYRLLQRRDRELGEAFNDPRRSTAMMQLAIINSRQLLEPEELMRFTVSTREVLTALAGDGNRVNAPNQPVQPTRAAKPTEIQEPARCGPRG